nr:Hypothetical protein HCH_06672 [uncultured bacterium]
MIPIANMKKAHRLLAVLVATTAVGAYWLNAHHTASSNADVVALNSAAHASKAATDGIAAAHRADTGKTIPAPATSLMSSWQVSPFSSGEGKSLPNNAIAQVDTAISKPDTEIVSAEELARRKKMEALGYMLPPDYYKKDINTLRQLAKNGDAFAMVHLGEKFYFELNGRPQNPDFEKGVDYASQARLSFSQALAAGNIRSAAIISETYLEENKRVEAYAWHILSEQLGDSISADWFKRTKVYATLTEQEKNQARQQLPKLMATVNTYSKQMNLTPVFPS